MPEGSFLFRCSYETITEILSKPRRISFMLEGHLAKFVNYQPGASKSTSFSFFGVNILRGFNAAVNPRKCGLLLVRVRVRVSICCICCFKNKGFCEYVGK